MTSFSLSSSDPRVPGHTFSNFLWKLRGAERGPRKFTELGVLGMRLTPEGCCCHCCSVTSNSLQPRGLQHARLFCPPLSPEICSDLCPLAFLIAQLVKNLPAMQEILVRFRVMKIRWRRDRLPTPVCLGFPCGSAGRESACKVGGLGSIPGLGRSPGERKGYPFQYAGLENSMDCIVHGVAKSRTRLSDFHSHVH